MSDERGAKSANIFDVARLAGVSHQTVSRVLNDLPNVRPAPRARVEQAMAQLRYSPSPAARALVTKRTRTIGLITPGTADFGPTSIAMHFNVAARVERYSVDSVTAPDTDAASIRSVVEGLLRQRVDAMPGRRPLLGGAQPHTPLVHEREVRHRYAALRPIEARCREELLQVEIARARLVHELARRGLLERGLAVPASAGQRPLVALGLGAPVHEQHLQRAVNDREDDHDRGDGRGGRHACEG